MDLATSKLYHVVVLLIVCGVAACYHGPKDPKHWKGGLEAGKQMATCAQYCASEGEEPVCGSDDQTYPNSCWADCSGIEVYFAGSCRDLYKKRDSELQKKLLLPRRIFW